MTHSELLQTKRDEILEIAARHGASNIRIFGSVARNEAGPKSDIDLLVTMEKGRGILNRAGLIIELEELLGCKVDVVADRALKSPVRECILHDARAL